MECPQQHLLVNDKDQGVCRFLSMVSHFPDSFRGCRKFPQHKLFLKPHGSMKLLYDHFQWHFRNVLSGSIGKRIKDWAERCFPFRETWLKTQRTRPKWPNRFCCSWQLSCPEKSSLHCKFWHTISCLSKAQLRILKNATFPFQKHPSYFVLLWQKLLWIEGANK